MVWPSYYVIDNFLTNDHYTELCNISVPVTNNDQWNANTDFDLSHIADYYLPQLMGYLQELAPEKVKFYKKYVCAIITTGANYRFHIHNDIPQKLLSTVVYLQPDNSTGTFLYDDAEGTNCREISWRPNRALIFSRNDNTWHSYRGDDKKTRKTLVFTLNKE